MVARELALSAFEASLLARSTPADVRTSPFPHLVRRDALPEPAYHTLVQRFPAPDTILHGRDMERSNFAARLPFFKVRDNQDVATDWRSFFATHVSQAFWLDIVRVFGSVIRARYPGLETRVGRRLEDWRVAPRSDAVKIGRDADVELDCQFVVNTPVRALSAVRTAHVDREDTLFSGLYYLREDGDDSGGDLQLGRWQRRRPRFLPGRMIIPSDVELVETVPYEANVFTCFVNGADSIHAVSPRAVTPRFRRYINIIAKVETGLFAVPAVGPVGRLLRARELHAVEDKRLGGDRR